MSGWIRIEEVDKAIDRATQGLQKEVRRLEGEVMKYKKLYVDYRAGAQVEADAGDEARAESQKLRSELLTCHFEIKALRGKK